MDDQEEPADRDDKRDQKHQFHLYASLGLERTALQAPATHSAERRVHLLSVGARRFLVSPDLG